MAQSIERSCTMLVHFDKPSSATEIKEALEGNDPHAKIQAMQKAIMMLLNGEQLPALFITIIRYVLPSEDHTIQKLLLLYLVRDRFITQLNIYKSRVSKDPFLNIFFSYTGNHREDRCVRKASSRDGRIVNSPPLAAFACTLVLIHCCSFSYNLTACRSRKPVGGNVD